MAWPVLVTFGNDPAEDRPLSYLWALDAVRKGTGGQYGETVEALLHPDAVYLLARRSPDNRRWIVNRVTLEHIEALVRDHDTLTDLAKGRLRAWVVHAEAATNHV